MTEDLKEKQEDIKSLQLFINPELFNEIYKKPSRKEIIKKVEEEIRKRGLD